MNENLNLLEILKDCPEGTKLYSPVFGDVEFAKVCQNDSVDFPIEFKLSDDSLNSVTTDGRLYEEFNGECILLPSKDQRDWSKFTAPWYKNENLVELKESDDERIKTAILNYLKKMWGNCQDDICGVHVEDAINWLEKQKDKDKLIQELGEYKVKYTQEVLEKYINSMSNKDEERLRKTTIAFLKDFAEQGYENAVECIDWLEKQDEDKKEINNFDVLPGLYKCIHRMFDGTPDGRLLFEIDNVYKCLSKHDRAEFEVSYGHSVYLEDPIVRKYFIPFGK